jgi:hypothetical protein
MFWKKKPKPKPLVDVDIERLYDPVGMREEYMRVMTALTEAIEKSKRKDKIREFHKKRRNHGHV